MEVNATQQWSCRMKRLNEWAERQVRRVKLFHQTIVQAHELGFVVVFEHKLPRPHFGFLVQEDLGTKVPLKFLES